MSSSIVTYTSISSNYEEPSDAGSSPGVVVYGYDGLPMHPIDPYVEVTLQAPEQAPPSPDYIADPEHPPSPDYPLPDDSSPTALSPGYIADSNPEEDSEEDPTNYPADGGYDDDDESSDDEDDDDESSDDDNDDDDVEEDKEEEDEEEEHLAPADSSVVPTVDLARHTLACRVDYRFVDTVDTSIRASESRVMTAIGEVNDRVTDLATTQRHDAQELYVHCKDAHDDRALLGAQVSILRRERRYFCLMASSYEREARQRIIDEDKMMAHIQHEHDRFRDLVRDIKAGPQDGPEDAGSSSAVDEEANCAPKCANYKRTSHLTQDCRSLTAAANNNQRAQGANQRVLTCFECRALGHFKNNYPKLRNKNQGNQARNGNSVARAYGVGTAGTNLNYNVVTRAFLLNNRYASILFDTSANRSFVSTTFSSLIDIIPTILDHGYDVKLADGRII
ncbi:hypothetical protein Tco_0600476 [Tanacetum coccineum]|uniref:Reverse transcriptase domain-containing protein n=1 Tax=Tanacetum coccineum TaxID=301880 RepID=A0ABQ4WBU1_9ASTR